MSIDVTVVGCGRWGSKHLLTLAKLREEGLISRLFACDPNPSEEAKLADGIISDSSMVNSHLAIIATPPDTHPELARQLLTRDIHLLVEKPLGGCEAEAAQVLSMARESGLLVGVGLLLRFHPAVKLASDQIAQGSIGSIQQIQYHRYTKRQHPKGANAIETLGVHGIDLACHLMGESEPSRIEVETSSKSEAKIILEFPHGIEAIIGVGWGAEEEKRLLTIEGSRGTLIIDLGIHDRLEIKSSTGSAILPCESNTSPLESELRHMIACVNSHTTGRSIQPIPGAGAALRGVRWTERAIRHSVLSSQIE